MLLSEYFSAFVETFEHVTLCNPPGTAYFLLGTEILEMVRSYLHDSEYFLHHDDIVNHYASLVYAHGWFIAGSYLGLYQISASNFTWENILFPGNYTNKLVEKTNRYQEMLSNAIASVSQFPAHGSPLAHAARYCLEVAKKNLLDGNASLANQEPVLALGHYCYGYGWLDTAVRAGLLQIHCNFYLFTTECQ